MQGKRTVRPGFSKHLSVRSQLHKPAVLRTHREYSRTNRPYATQSRKPTPCDVRGGGPGDELPVLSGEWNNVRHRVFFVTIAGPPPSQVRHITGLAEG